MQIESKRATLIRETTMAEYWLAMHVRQALWAREFRDKGWIGLARTYGEGARNYLVHYLKAKEGAI